LSCAYPLSGSQIPGIHCGFREMGTPPLVSGNSMGSVDASQTGPPRPDPSPTRGFPTVSVVDRLPHRLHFSNDRGGTKARPPSCSTNVVRIETTQNLISR